MTFLALIAIIFFSFAVYNLTCAFVDIPTKKTSQMMMLSRKQQGTKNEKLLDVYVTKIAGWIAPYLRLDRLKRNKVQRALDIAGLQLTPEVYTARAWVTAGAVGLCAIPMALLIPLLVPILIGLAVALWFSTYYPKVSAGHVSYRRIPQPESKSLRFFGRSSWSSARCHPDKSRAPPPPCIPVSSAAR